MGAVDGEEATAAFSSRFVFVRSRRRRELICVLNCFCVFLSVWESSYRWFSGYLHSGIWRRQGLPHRIARDQSLGECDWALDGRSERGDQNEPSRNTSPHSLRAAPVIRRDSSDMFSSRKSAWKRHGTCYYNFT
ncbi:hypothetical protein CABS03_13451 [Colletotrichum abscissum]|uniref:Uncharacterized protein n=1 Tax=Colletotrichum abscissum TaxID=1671311 RepID=A0A9P9X7D6_9PEZI|nr:hypothetical protein CABS02_11052 [Colletotrichum abscissum]